MNDVIRRAIGRVSVHDVLRLFGVEAVKGFIDCPVCGSGRAQVSDSGKVWTCWAGKCQENNSYGSVGLAAQMWKISNTEAAERLLGEVSPERPQGRNDARVAGRSEVATAEPRGEAARALYENPAWQTWLSSIVSRAQANLADPSCLMARRARVYLVRKRGLSIEMCKSARLGLTTHWHIESRVVNGREMKIAPGILIPWIKPGGGYCGAIVRELEPGTNPQKYLMASGSRRSWMYPSFGTPFDQTWAYDGPLVVTESELDALLLQEKLSGLAAVKTLGSAVVGPSGLVDSERAELAKMPVIAVAADADQAGEDCREMWSNYSRRVLSLTMPAGVKDIGEAAAGGVDLRAWYLSELARLGLSVRLEAGVDVAERKGHREEEHEPGLQGERIDK